MNSDTADLPFFFLPSVTALVLLLRVEVVFSLGMLKSWNERCQLTRILHV